MNTALWTLGGVIVGWPLACAAVAWTYHRTRLARPPVPVKPDTTHSADLKTLHRLGDLDHRTTPGRQYYVPAGRP